MQLVCHPLVRHPPVRRPIVSRQLVFFGSLSILAALLLAGCGWRLQGSARLPASMVSVRIDTQDRYSDFYRELRAHLLIAGAQLTAQESVSSAVIHVKVDQTGQRMGPVSTSNRPEQYEVYYRVAYSLEIAGVEIIAEQPMELTANYSYDTAAVLAKQREQLVIQQALARELAEQVLRRLTASSTHVPVSQAAGN
jgi:LPS-assembly lipoprotein